MTRGFLNLIRPVTYCPFDAGGEEITPDLFPAR